MVDLIAECLSTDPDKRPSADDAIKRLNYISLYFGNYIRVIPSALLSLEQRIVVTMHIQTKEIASMLDLAMPSFKTQYEQDDLPNIVPYDHIVIPTP